METSLILWSAEEEENIFPRGTIYVICLEYKNITFLSKNLETYYFLPDKHEKLSLPPSFKDVNAFL